MRYNSGSDDDGKWTPVVLSNSSSSTSFSSRHSGSVRSDLDEIRSRRCDSIQESLVEDPILYSRNGSVNGEKLAILKEIRSLRERENILLGKLERIFREEINQAASSSQAVGKAREDMTKKRFEETKQTVAPSVETPSSSQGSTCSLYRRELQRQTITSPNSTSVQGPLVKKVGAKVRVKSGQEVCEGVISELDGIYLSIKKVVKISPNGDVTKYPYPLTFRNNDSVEVIGSCGSPGDIVHSTPNVSGSRLSQMRKSPSNDSSTSFEHSPADTTSSKLKNQSQETKLKLVAGKRAWVQTDKVHVRGLVESYQRGQLVLKNVFDMRQGKYIGEELSIDDREIVNCKQYDLISVDEPQPSMATKKPHRDFASFKASTGGDEGTQSTQSKYLCRPAGYTPSTYPPRETRKKATMTNDKPYSESISFR